MHNKSKVIGLIFGGKSAEHDVSIMSAEFIKNYLIDNNFEVILIGIDNAGHWRFVENYEFLNIVKRNARLDTMKKIIPIPQGGGELLVFENSTSNKLRKIKIDIAFPILHGPMGEDGAIQGLLKILDIPFVGSDVLGSALGMDKVLMKKVLRDSNIPIADFLYFNKSQQADIDYANASNFLGAPFFIKPANMGSSIGISRVNSKHEFEEAVNLAFEYDSKIIMEKFIHGRELECSVLGDDIFIKASLPGEIKLNNNKFYSYSEKYSDNSMAVIEIPAKIGQDLIKEVKDLAIQTFRSLDCHGMGRVDFFLTDDNKLFVNEINTIPGFTKISMYPKLWEISGLTSRELIYSLVDLSIKRFGRQKKLKTFV